MSIAIRTEAVDLRKHDFVRLIAEGPYSINWQGVRYLRGHGRRSELEASISFNYAFFENGKSLTHSSGSLCANYTTHERFDERLTDQRTDSANDQDLQTGLPQQHSQKENMFFDVLVRPRYIPNHLLFGTLDTCFELNVATNQLRHKGKTPSPKTAYHTMLEFCKRTGLTTHQDRIILEPCWSY